MTSEELSSHFPRLGVATQLTGHRASCTSPIGTTSDTVFNNGNHDIKAYTCNMMTLTKDLVTKCWRTRTWRKLGTLRINRATLSLATVRYLTT